jgi:hypothetical protein
MNTLILKVLVFSLFCSLSVSCSDKRKGFMNWTKSERLGDQLYIGIQEQPDGSFLQFTASSDSEKDDGGRRRALLPDEATNEVPFREFAPIIIPKRKKSNLITQKPEVKKITDAKND